MKRALSVTIFTIGCIAFLSGCSANQSLNQPAANSGVVDKDYNGDPNPVLKEEYKQTPAEAKALEDLMKAIEEELFESGGISGI